MILSPKALEKLGAQVREEPGLRRPVQVQGPRRRRPHHARQVADYYDARRCTSSGSCSRSSPTRPRAPQNLRAGDVDVNDRLEPTDVPTLQERLEHHRAQGADDRLPGHHDQHRQQERPAASCHTRTSGRRSASTPSCARRSTLALDRNLINKVVFYRLRSARLRPDLARQPVVLRQGPARAAGRERRARRSSSSGEERRQDADPGPLLLGNDASTRASARSSRRWRRRPASTSRSTRREFTTAAEHGDPGDFDAFQFGWSGRIDPDGNLYGFSASEGSPNYSRLREPEARLHRSNGARKSSRRGQARGALPAAMRSSTATAT